jgi:altronate hydrolase
MNNRALKIDPNDNLYVALEDLPAGAVVDGITIAEPIEQKHKFAAIDLPKGSTAIMYGVTVGETVTDVPAGGLLTIENLAHKTATFGPKSKDLTWTAPDVSRWSDIPFFGYHRSDGKVGTANHWIVVPLVFCENRNLDVLREALTRALGYNRIAPYESYAAALATADDLESIPFPEQGVPATPRFENIDGIKFLRHGLGCGGTRQDAAALCGLIAGYITHPNVAGATILSLGCQNAEVSLLQKEIARRSPNHDRPVIIFEQQKQESEQKMLARAIRDTIAGMAVANKQTRQPAPLSKLVVGMECGGSDGFSGISANPVIGYCSDLISALGGSVILSEFPELCGAEQALSDRCVDLPTSERFVDLMTRYNARALADGSGFHANPSPGNIRDGLITDAIKSAGAAKKGGTSPVVDVLDYPEQITKPGLTLLCTPGNDVESTTAMAGAGANVMLFSTGLGTPTGNPVCPVLKLSTNTDLVRRMPDIIDFDTGPIITGNSTIEEMGERLFNLILATANGEEKPRAVELGQDDFLPWKRGVSL